MLTNPNNSEQLFYSMLVMLSVSFFAVIMICIIIQVMDRLSKEQDDKLEKEFEKDYPHREYTEDWDHSSEDEDLEK